MSYTKHTWVTGETITAEKLNNIEDGLSNVEENQIPELKNTIDQLASNLDASVDTVFLEFKSGYYSVPGSGSVLDLSANPLASNTIVYAVADIDELTPIYVNIACGGSSSAGARAWAMVDENNIVIDRSGANKTLKDALLMPFPTAKKLLVQTYITVENYYARIGFTQNEKIERIIDKQKKSLGTENDELFSGTFTRNTIGTGSGLDIGTTGKRYESSKTRLCTKPWQDISMLYDLSISVDEGYKYYLYFLNKDLTAFVRNTGWTTVDTVYEIPPEVPYVIVSLAKTNDGTIVEAESEHIHISGCIIGSKLDDINEHVDSALNDINDRIEAISVCDDTDPAYETFSAHFNADGEVSPVIFFTDPHVYNKNVTDAARNALYNKLQKAWFNTVADCVICGGDILQGGADDIISGGPSEAQACNQLAKAIGTLKGLFGADFHVVFGNHDGNYKNTAFTGLAKYNIMFGGDSAYYTFAYRNTRYYVFDTLLDNGIGDMTDYRKGEATWFATQLEENQEPNIVICFHIFYNNSTYTDANIPAVIRNVIKAAQAYNARSAEFIAPWKTSEVHDYSQVTGKVCYGLAGHLHADLIGEYDGFPVIMTTKALINYNTPTFDLVCGDWSAKNVYCDRVGVGGNRTLHFDPLSITSEETLTTTLSDSTWGTTDSAVATVADGVVTPASTGYTIITATDESGNVEAWNVWVTT